jgi:hypothetical protein
MIVNYAVSGAVIILTLAGCATTSVTPVAKNQIIISASAAPACGRSGAARVAAKMAASETIRRGYQRYIIVGANSANNVHVSRTGPTYAQTYSNATYSGNRMAGNSTTYFGGQQTIIGGTHDSDLAVVMFNPREPGFENAIDARTELGEGWEKIVKDGIHSCT